MKFLIDLSERRVKEKQKQFPHLVLGQLCTPLTNYKNWGGTFAMDNGAYSGLDREAFFRLLKKHEEHKDNCLFVAVPDIVGNWRRTMELYFAITMQKPMYPWTKKWAMVLQDGCEDARIDWHAVRCLFVGGTDKFKNSNAVIDIIKTAKAIGVPVHVGRVNSPGRYERFAEVGADTCDGSGVCRFDWMLEAIASQIKHPTLFDGEGNEHSQDNDSCEVSA